MVNRCCSPLTTHHSPLTTHHSPLTTHDSPLTDRAKKDPPGRRGPRGLQSVDSSHQRELPGPDGHGATIANRSSLGPVFCAIRGPTAPLGNEADCSSIAASP